LSRTVKPNLFSLVAAEGAQPAATPVPGVGVAAPEESASASGAVDFRLARAATLQAWRSGRLRRHEVCDAQQELYRNAEFCGRPAGRGCPVCAAAGLVEVTYVFGSRLPKHGRCVTTTAEMQRLKHRASRSTGYVVEVCTDCGWNHLVRRFMLGGTRSV